MGYLITRPREEALKLGKGKLVQRQERRKLFFKLSLILNFILSLSLFLKIKGFF